MKKIIIWIFITIVFITMLLCKSVYAATPTLDEIANQFNNCSTVKEYVASGSMKATSNGNKLNISVTSDGTTTNFEYTLEDSILSTSFSGDSALAGSVVAIALTDCIGQLHGYSDGELFSTLNSEKIYNYTVENEGFEIKETSDNGFQIKIDISKKIPLIDVSDEYFKVDDLQSLKSYISGDGTAEDRKGNVWFNKNGYDGKNTLLVAEKKNLTESTYKSILSIVEVMFDSDKAVNYFKTNYSSMSVGNKEFSGFKIEINPTKTEFEAKLIPEDSDCEFVRITIDKNEASKAFANLNSSNETTNTENKVANISVMPRTGKQQNPLLIVLYILIAITSISIVTLTVTRKRA